MLYRKITVRLHFIKNVLYLFISCMSARIVFSIPGIILSSLQLFLKKWNPFVKSKCHGEKMVMRPNLIKECIALFSQNIFLCKNIASYLKEYKATCSFNTNIFYFKEFSMCMIIAPFWQQYKMSITHCMLCRNLIFWKTYCMIEGRLHFSIKGRTTTFLRKERCMFRGLLYIL